MIENAALRAIIAVAVFVVGWWLLGRALLGLNMLFTWSLWVAFVMDLAFAVRVFLGLKKPGRDPSQAET